MPPVRRCFPKRPVRAAGLSLRGPEDALGALLAGTTPDRPTATYLLLDTTHCGVTCLEVSGRGDADAVFDNNLVATRMALAAGATGAPTIDDVMVEADGAWNPFFRDDRRGQT